MESIDKLREWSCSTDLHEIADEIEAEITDNYLELPVDADGVPIQIGDVLELPGMDDYYPSEVVRLIYDGFEDEWFFDGEVLGSFTGQVGHYDTAGWVHYVKPRTLEDVLVDMLEDAVGYSDAHTDVSLVAVEKYADEIRELLGGDAE